MKEDEFLCIIVRQIIKSIAKIIKRIIIRDKKCPISLRHPYLVAVSFDSTNEITEATKVWKVWIAANIFGLY